MPSAMRPAPQMTNTARRANTHFVRTAIALRSLENRRSEQSPRDSPGLVQSRSRFPRGSRREPTMGYGSERPLQPRALEDGAHGVDLGETRGEPALLQEILCAPLALCRPVERVALGGVARGGPGLAKTVRGSLHRLRHRVSGQRTVG